MIVKWLCRKCREDWPEPIIEYASDDGGHKHTCAGCGATLYGIAECLLTSPGKEEATQCGQKK